MNLLKRLSNILFGTHYHVDIEPYHDPSKRKLISNMYRPYGEKPWH